MSSPLNPNARKPGKRYVAPKQANLKQVVEGALDAAATSNDGMVSISFNGVDITVHDTDKIGNVVAEVRRRMNQQ